MIATDGEIISAGAALPELLAIVGRHRFAMSAFRRFPTLTERGYRWVANHRNALGKLTRRWAAVRGHTYPPIITEGDREVTRCSIA
jgi:predicted DCC family thiol-disulfide oxidoreductase YuxK